VLAFVVGCGAPGRTRAPATLAAGTQLEVEVVNKLSSETSGVGDVVEGRLASPVSVGERVVLPAGTGLVGRVTEVVPTRKIGGQARLGFSFESIELDNGERVPIHSVFARAGKSQNKKDAAIIAGAAAGGGLIGRATKKKHRSKGTAVGVVVGAAVGTAIAATNEGDPVVVPAGSVILIELQRSVEVSVGE
jgi:hypothetical protein